MTHQHNRIHWNARDRNGAQAIAEQLKIAGLIGSFDNLLIGNPGSGEEWLYLELAKEIHMALAEAAVGSIADGASRLHHKPAVAIAHGFVGFSGLQGDIFNAAQRQSPMLIIVGTADSQAHTDETHIYGDVMAAARAAGSKYVKNATDPATLLRDLRDAIAQAQTPPFGPVVFIVGSDILSAPNTELPISPTLANSRLAAPPSVIELVADQMLASERPSILTGDGVAQSGAQTELVRVAELLGADVRAWMESEVNFPRSHPLFRGNLGHMDDARVRESLKDTDYALVVGTPIYQTVFNSKMPLFGPSVRIAAINPDPETSPRGHNNITLPIKGDPKRILELLSEALEQKRPDRLAASVEARIQLQRERKQATLWERRERQLAQPGVTLAKFANLLEQRMKDMSERPIIFNDEFLIGGVGLTDHIGNVDMPGKYFDVSGASLGEWAGAIGTAISGGPTIAFIGDGSFNYAPQALWNAARKRLPLGMVIANNAEYGLLYANMGVALAARGIDPQTIPRRHYFELAEIDYVKIGEGYGVPGMRVESETHLQEAIDQLLKFEEPFLIDLVLTSPR